MTDLHQGIVWGTQTAETRLDERLINRFDYDGDYGTVLNRFLMQAAIGYPLTVHGTGGQTRAFIHIQDTVRCIQLAIENPPERGDRVRIFNQMTECHRVIDLAEIVARLTGAEIDLVAEPAQGGQRRERPARGQRPPAQARARPDHARGGADDRGHGDRRALRRPLRPRDDPLYVGLAPAADGRGRHGAAARVGALPLTHLQRLEAESIQIMREVVAEAEKPVMLYSIGKDSAVMLHLALKAFYPGKPPFPLLHVDTTWKFREMYEFRDRMAGELGLELLVHVNARGSRGRQPVRRTGRRCTPT